MKSLNRFVAKLAVVSAAIDEASIAIVVAALVAGALTLLSMTKIWIGVFWGRDIDGPSPVVTAPNNRRTMHAATSLAVVGTLTISLFAGTLFDLSLRAAEDLRQPATYVAEVRS